MIQITPHSTLGGCRGYDSQEERDNDIKKLKEEGFNYFTPYRDTQATIALSYGVSEVTEHVGPHKRPWQPKPGDSGYDLMC